MSSIVIGDIVHYKGSLWEVNWIVLDTQNEHYSRYDLKNLNGQYVCVNRSQIEPAGLLATVLYKFDKMRNFICR